MGRTAAQGNLSPVNVEDGAWGLGAAAFHLFFFGGGAPKTPGLGFRGCTRCFFFFWGGGAQSGGGGEGLPVPGSGPREVPELCRSRRSRQGVVGFFGISRSFGAHTLSKASASHVWPEGSISKREYEYGVRHTIAFLSAPWFWKSMAVGFRLQPFNPSNV